MWRLAVLTMLLGLPGVVAAQPTAEAERSLAWLRGQLVPNAALPTPDPQRRGLVQSYAMGAGGRPGPLFRKSFAYDTALAAIAFTTAGDGERAVRLLQALTRIQRADGSFWFAYAVDTRWPDEADHDMAIVRAGATAWAGYALTFYLEHAPPPQDARAHRERARLLTAARQVGAALLALRVGDEPAAARGLVRGGRALVRLVAEPSGRAVQEVYEDRPVRWVSTEHNVSAYFLFGALARLTAEPGYAEAARAIRERLLGVLWQDDLGQFAQGILEDGRLDRTLALDAASWGALFCLAAGEPGRAARAVETADRRYRAVHDGVAGHRPYHGKPVYDDPAVQRALLPDAPDARWRDLPIVWAEGSLGVALARLRLGEAVRAREIVREVLRLREGDGLRLASRDLPYELAGAPGVAATAWHVLVESALHAPTSPGVWSR
jgi:hypothetical protein